MFAGILAFALNSTELLKYGKGISGQDEPDIWEVDRTGQIQHWIMLGQPEEKRIRQACGKSERVSIYTYQIGPAMPWFEGIKSQIERFKHLRVVHIAVPNEASVAKLVRRNMEFVCTVQDGQLMLSSGDDSLVMDMQILKDFVP